MRSKIVLSITPCKKCCIGKSMDSIIEFISKLCIISMLLDCV